MQIVNVKDYSGGIGKATDYIHGVWGNVNNYSFYYDAIKHSSLPRNPLPKFYLLLKHEEIIGCVALITNDFISRHDLYPWLASLFIDPEHRGSGYANLLMEHVEQEAKDAGFENIYLTTDHDGYYERYGWERMENGIDLFTSKPTRIYTKKL